MTPEEAPVGTIVVIGNPANGLTATKAEVPPGVGTYWRYNVWPFETVEHDDLHKGATIIFNPGVLPDDEMENPLVVDLDDESLAWLINAAYRLDEFGMNDRLPLGVIVYDSSKWSSIPRRNFGMRVADWYWLVRAYLRR